MTTDRTFVPINGFCPGCDCPIGSSWACARCWQMVPPEIREMRRQAWNARSFKPAYLDAKEAMVRWFMERRSR